MPNQVKSDLIFNERLTDFSVDICNRIMNSEFFDGIEQLFGTDAEVISHVFIHFNKVFLSIIILALTINGIETVVKAVKYSRQ